MKVLDPGRVYLNQNSRLKGLGIREAVVRVPAETSNKIVEYLRNNQQGEPTVTVVGRIEKPENITTADKELREVLSVSAGIICFSPALDVTCLPAPDAPPVGKECTNPKDCAEDAEQFYTGNVFPTDVARAVELWSRACDGEHYEACTRLAAAIEKGAAGKVDETRILALVERGCLGGVAHACQVAAEQYASGKGTAKNPAKSLSLLRKACDFREFEACTTAAIRLQRGEGAAPDSSEAARYFDIACTGTGGKGPACVLLALAYENGTGVTKDLNRALAIYEKGCAAQDQDLCGALGGFLMEAEPPIGDKARGKLLSEKACRHGNQAACQWLRQVAMAPAAAPINLSAGKFTAATPQWKAARDAVVAWCSANAGKCTEQALDDLRKPADGVLEVGAGADATLTTCSPGNCPGASFVEFKRSGASWSVTKVEWSPMGD